MDDQFVRSWFRVEAEEAFARAQTRNKSVGPLTAQATAAARRQAPRVKRAALQRTLDAAATQSFQQRRHPLGTVRGMLRAFHADTFPQRVSLPRVPGEVVLVLEHQLL